MNSSKLMHLLPLGLFLSLPVAVAGRGNAPTDSKLTLCGSEGNEFYGILRASGISCKRIDSFQDAVKKAAPGSGVMLLGEGYPSKQTVVDLETLELSRKKNLRLYIEFPDKLPGYAFDKPATISRERVVVTSDLFGSSAPQMRIVTVNDCHYLPTTASQVHLRVARVAGYDTAVFGLPQTSWPVLFEAPEFNALVATASLSNFSRGRYGPAREWKAIWQAILNRINGAPVSELKWTPSVRPAHGPTEKLPSDAERRALIAAGDWLFSSRLLLSKERQPEVHRQLNTGAEVTPLPSENEPIGDGTLGILEGYSSNINYDGTQGQRLPIRFDCQAESAMLLALDAALTSDSRKAEVSRNLLDFSYGPSGFCGGVRADPKHGAYGLIAWGAVYKDWIVANYGDDDARGILGTLAAAALLNTNEWDTPVLRAIAANFRTTGRKGFRGDRIDVPELEKHGWRYFSERELVNPAANFEAWMWACYLVAYKQTGYEPFLSLTRTGISEMMKVYPKGWRWNDNNEIARMVFTLAFLVQADDTAEHRNWLDAVSKDLLTRMHPSGALIEKIVGTGGGHYQVAQTNETFGTGESPLIQKNGDPVSDQLYGTAFALIALHEAVAVTHGAELKAAEDALAKYLCRIQVRSDVHKYLEGAWLRAFDFDRWDYWASSGDIGWGPWCAETGWGQAWIATALGMRERRQSFWDLITSRDLKDNWPVIQAEMLPPDLHATR